MSGMQTFQASWRARAPREKLLIIGGACLALAAVVDLGAIEPWVASTSAAQSTLKKRQAEWDGLVKRRQALSADVDALGLDAGAQKSSKDQLVDAIAANRLWDERSAARWLDEMVAAFGPDVVRASIANQGDPDTQLRSLFAHPVEIEARAEWKKIDLFLRAQSPVAALRLERLDMVSDETGRVTMLARFQALSATKAWGDGRGALTTKPEGSP